MDRRRSDSAFLSLPNHLHEHTFRTPPIEFAVEDLFPRTKIQLAIRDRYDDFATHDLTFVMGIAVILARPIVPVPGWRWIERSQVFEPFL